MAALVRLLAIPFTLVTLGVTGLTTAASFSTLGAEGLEHPEGLSLRQESAGSPAAGGFFLWYASSRGHVGGGLRGGK